MERRFLEDDDEVGGNIKTMVSFVVEQIVKEDRTERGASLWGVVKRLDRTCNKKDAKVFIWQMSAEQGEVWCKETKHFGGHDIKQMTGSARAST